MTVKMSRKTKSLLAVTVAASINGALFVPAALASTQGEVVSESRLATGKRINLGDDNAANRELTRGDCELRIKDVDMVPENQELRQANQAPQQVLQLLRGQDQAAQETTDAAEVRVVERLDTGKRINTAEDDSAGLNTNRHTERLESSRLENDGLRIGTCDEMDEKVIDESTSNDTELKPESPIIEQAPVHEDALTDDLVAPVSDSVEFGEDSTPQIVTESSDDSTGQTLAKTGSETTMFAGIAAALAGAVGAMLLWVSRKRSSQN